MFIQEWNCFAERKTNLEARKVNYMLFRFPGMKKKYPWHILQSRQSDAYKQYYSKIGSSQK